MEKWRKLGEFHGYPKCCVEAFVKAESNHNTVFSGTGFLPCKDCNKKDPKEIIDYIDSHRQEPLKFPVDNSPMLFVRKEKIDLIEKIRNGV